MNDYNNFLDLMRRSDTPAKPVSVPPQKKNDNAPPVQQQAAAKEDLSKPILAAEEPRKSSISPSAFLEQLPDGMIDTSPLSDTLIRKRERPVPVVEEEQSNNSFDYLPTEEPQEDTVVSVAEILSEEQKAAVRELAEALEKPAPEKVPAEEPQAAAEAETATEADQAVVDEVVAQTMAQALGTPLPEQPAAEETTEQAEEAVTQEPAEVAPATEETAQTKTAETADSTPTEAFPEEPQKEEPVKSSRSLFEKTRTLHNLPSLQKDREHKQRTKLLNRNDKLPNPEKTRNIGDPVAATTGLRKTDGDDISVFFPAAEEDKGSLLRAIAKSAAIEEAPEAEQLSMSGFEQPKPEITDEDTIEEEVRIAREKRIEEFGLGAQAAPPELDDNEADFKNKSASLPAFVKKVSERFADKATPFAPVKGEEYQNHEQHRFAFRALLKTRSNTLIRTGILLGIGLVLLLMNIITTASAAANNGFFTVFGASVSAYTTVNLVLLLAAGALLLPDFKNAFISILQLHPRTEAALLGMYVTVLIQTLCQYFTAMQPESSYHLFTGAAVLLSAIYMFSKTLWYDSVRHCFRTITLTGSKHYLREVRSPKALRKLLSEYHTEGLRADFSARTAFVSDFFADSADAARSAMPRSFLVPAVWVVCILSGIVTAIAAKSPVTGLSAAAAASCFAFPVCSLISCGLMMRSANKELGNKKSYIRSLQDARGFVTVDHFAFDADELFDVELRKTYSIDTVSEKNALTAACVLAYHAGGTLSTAFCADMNMKDKKIPVPEEIKYEEKLGICAWVDNCRVLLGTAEMLVNHNVEPGSIPQADPDCRLLHLAVEGKPIAAFALHYSCDAEKAKGLQSAAKAGVNLLIRTNDPLITPDMVQKTVDLPDNSIKIVAKSGAELFDSLHDGVAEKESTGIVTANGFKGLCICAAKAVALERDSHLAGVTTTLCSLIGAFAALLLSFTGGISRATGWSAVLLQLLWIAVIIAVPQLAAMLEKNGKKKTTAKKKVMIRKQAEEPAISAEEDTEEAPAQEETQPADPVQPAEEETAAEEEYSLDAPAEEIALKDSTAEFSADTAAEEFSLDENTEITKDNAFGNDAQDNNTSAPSTENLNFVLNTGFDDIFGINS